jgi:hypothetical protein
MPVIVRTTLLLAASNIFMTFAWCAHLKNLTEERWYALHARAAEARLPVVRTVLTRRGSLYVSILSAIPLQPSDTAFTL